jgi:hypothetical protein
LKRNSNIILSLKGELRLRLQRNDDKAIKMKRKKRASVPEIIAMKTKYDIQATKSLFLSLQKLIK